MFRFIKVNRNQDLLQRLFQFRSKIVYEKFKELGRLEELPSYFIDQDRYDFYSEHFIALNDKEQIIATVRLIHHSSIGYPTENSMKIDPSIKKCFEREKLGEISRIFIDKRYRNFKDTRVIIDEFIQMIYLDLKRYKLAYTYGALEKKFLRLLKIFHIPYEVIGELQEYVGMRYPCILYTKVLEKEHPKIIEKAKGLRNV